MSTTTTDPTIPFVETGTRKTTAFDQDNRQRENELFYMFDSSRYRHSKHFVLQRLLSKERLVAGRLDIFGGDQRADTPLSAAIKNVRFFAELEQLLNRLRNNVYAYRARIEMLKGEADDEGIVFSDTSEQDFWEFMRSIPYALKADVVVTDSGNLRAVWREGEVRHVGLQFLGGRWVEYVMWTRRSGSMQLSTKAGRDTFEGVKEQIRASGLASFLGLPWPAWNYATSIT